MLIYLRIHYIVFSCAMNGMVISVVVGADVVLVLVVAAVLVGIVVVKTNI